MIGFGFQEVLNFMMTSKENLFTKMNRPEEQVVEVLNPVSSEYAVLRDALIPGLLDILSQNLHVQYPQKVFECGDVVEIRGEETYPKSIRKLAAAICDNKASYEDAQAITYSLLKNLGITGWKVSPYEIGSYLEGRAAKLILEGEEIVIIGEIHPETLERFGLNKPVTVFEISLDTMLRDT
jgi:phenylalanyl-tRNA synthetase beta chain